MTVLMKNSQKVLPFPQPPKAPGAIICQIGDERFAIHYEIEDLPPAAPLLPWKRGSKKVQPKIVK